MAYTTTQLITNAWYLSGVVARGLEIVDGAQITEGLNLLNALLAIKTANNRLIPYYTFYSLNLITNQESYFIPNLISIETITFNIEDVRYSMLKMSRKPYFGSARVDAIDALPFSWHVERSVGGATFYVYYLPSDTYLCKIWGKFSLAEVALGQDLSLTLDLFYIEYLRYALAEYICADYNITFQPQSMSKLTEYEQIITDISPIDLSMTKLSTLQSNFDINWGDVNIGKGWRPS